MKSCGSELPAHEEPCAVRATNPLAGSVAMYRSARPAVGAWPVTRWSREIWMDASEA